MSKSLKCRQPELIDLPKTTDYEVVEMTTLEDPTTRPKVNSIGDIHPKPLQYNIGVKIYTKDVVTHRCWEKKSKLTP